MTFDRMVRLLALEVPDDVSEACRFLESRGQTFCCEFGTENAVDKAAELLIEDMEKG